MGVGLPIPGFVVGLKFKVGDGTVMAYIVRNWGRIIVGSGACVLRK